MCPSSPNSPSTQRKQRCEQCVKLENFFRNTPRPCPRSRTPSFFHLVPSPPARAPPSTLLPPFRCRWSVRGVKDKETEATKEKPSRSPPPTRGDR